MYQLNFSPPETQSHTPCPVCTWMCSEVKDAVMRGVRDQPHAPSFLGQTPRGEALHLVATDHRAPAS